jgi:hypothetical protein
MANRYGDYDMNNFYFELKTFLENHKYSELLQIISDIVKEQEDDE